MCVCVGGKSQATLMYCRHFSPTRPFWPHHGCSHISHKALFRSCFVHRSGVCLHKHRDRNGLEFGCKSLTEQQSSFESLRLCSNLFPGYPSALSFSLSFMGLSPGTVFAASLLYWEEEVAEKRKLNAVLQIPPYDHWEAGNNCLPQPIGCTSLLIQPHMPSLLQDTCCWLMLFYLGDPADIMLMCFSETILKISC